MATGRIVLVALGLYLSAHLVIAGALSLGLVTGGAFCCLLIFEGRCIVRAKGSPPEFLATMSLVCAVVGSAMAFSFRRNTGNSTGFASVAIFGLLAAAYSLKSQVAAKPWVFFAVLTALGFGIGRLPALPQDTPSPNFATISAEELAPSDAMNLGGTEGEDRYVVFVDLTCDECRSLLEDIQRTKPKYRVLLRHRPLGNSAYAKELAVKMERKRTPSLRLADAEQRVEKDLAFCRKARISGTPTLAYVSASGSIESVSLAAFRSRLGIAY